MIFYMDDDGTLRLDSDVVGKIDLPEGSLKDQIREALDGKFLDDIRVCAGMSEGVDPY